MNEKECTVPCREKYVSQEVNLMRANIKALTEVVYGLVASLEPVLRTTEPTDEERKRREKPDVPLAADIYDFNNDIEDIIICLAKTINEIEV